MDAHDFAVFYPRLATDLRRIEADATPGWVPTRHGLRPTWHVLAEAGLGSAVWAVVTVWLVLGLICWGWAEWWWILAALTGGSALIGVSDTVRCARPLMRHYRGRHR